MATWGWFPSENQLVESIQFKSPLGKLVSMLFPSCGLVGKQQNDITASHTCTVMVSLTTNDSNTLVNLPWGISAADCTQLHVGIVEFHLKTVAWHCACTMTTTCTCVSPRAWQWTRAVWRGGVCRLVTEDKGNRSLMCDSYSLDSRVFSSSLSVLRRWRFIVVICLTWTYPYSRLCIFIYANLLGDLVLRNATCAREGEKVLSYSTI